MVEMAEMGSTLQFTVVYNASGNELSRLHWKAGSNSQCELSWTNQGANVEILLLNFCHCGKTRVVL